MEFTQQQQSALTNSNMEEDAFNRSINSKLSDWTSVFDSNVELSPYKFCWSPARSNGSASPNLKRSRDSLLSESAVYENVVKVREQLRELFDESFNQLCNEIQKSFDSWEFGQEVYLNDLLEREALLRAHAEQLAEVAPEMSELIGLKLSSLSRSMEQLRLKHDADAKLNQSDRSAVTHLRKWLQTTEFKLVQIKQDVSLAVLDINELQSLRVKLQAVQLEIETDGKQLIQFAKRYFAKKALEWTTDSRRIQRLKRNLEALETRWYNLLLATVETLEQLNNYIERSPSGDDNSDIESVSSAEPLRKRCRHSFDQDQYDQKPEDYEDTIPFSASEYEPYMSSSGEEHGSDVEYENHRGQIVANRSAMVSADDSLLDKTPTELVHRTSSAEDGWSSSGKTHDVGYSSGENSVHEALNSIGKESPVTEATQTDSSDLHRMRTQTSPVNSYYRTVPLDDFGTTDTETPRFAPVPSLNLIEDSNHGNQVLTESMVVHASEQSDDSVSHNPEKDYKEIMKIIDENSIRMGTSWKELKSASNRRLSATPSKCNSVGRMSNRRSLPTAGKMSCDASSEDSDYNTGPLLPAQLSVSFNGKPSNWLAVPPVNSHSQPQMMQRKRRFQRQAPNSASKLATSLNNSILKNLTMEQSVYEPMICNESNEDELMSQSLNLPSLSGKCLDSRKRLIRRRMRRTASDNTDLNFYVGNLTPNIQPETKRQVERRNSMESNSSSTTFHDSGDAHFEWDEYREEPLAEDVQMAPNTDLSMSKHSKVSIMPILTAPDVDEDFQNELAFVDVHNNMGVNDFLSQSRESLGESYRLLQSQQGSDDALRLNAISVGRIAMDNLRRIRAIMRSSTVLDMQCLDAFEKLHAEWLELIGKHKIPAHDTLSAQEVSDVLKLFRRIREYYLLFGQTCGQPDSEFIKSATVDELKTRLNLRKESFIELQKLHEKMASTVRQFSELQPDLDRVTANINLLSRSVANLDCFYQISGLRQSLKNLYKRLDEVTTVVNRLSNGTNSTHISDHKVENQLRRIDSELTDCQNRMSSLETACNNIISWLNKNNNDLGVDEDEVECMKKIIQQFGETKSEVIGMRTRFDSLLKSHCPDLLCRPSSQLNEDSYSDSSVSKFSTSELKLRRRRHSSEAESVDLQTTSNGKVASSRNNSASSQTTTAIQQSSTLKTLFSCMILVGMGIFILYMTADDELFSRSGHWRFKFGPQLKYVNGPPPF